MPSLWDPRGRRIRGRSQITPRRPSGVGGARRAGDGRRVAYFHHGKDLMVPVGRDVSDRGNEGGEKNSAPSGFLRMIAEPRPSVLASAAQARRSSCATSNSGCSILRVNGVGGEPRRPPKFGDEGAGLSDGSNEGRFRLVRGGRAGGIVADIPPPWTCAVYSGTILSSDRVKSNAIRPCNLTSRKGVGLNKRYETPMINKWRYRNS